MKKILTGIAILGMLSLFAGCEPDIDDPTTDDPTTTDPTEEPSVSPSDTTITTTDTIRITWNGASATIEGTHDDVTVSDNSGYVTINSSVKDITYILSGNGQGQLTIYGTNRHQLILSGLSLVCSDGPAINNQCKKSCFVVLEGTNSLTDGSSYSSSDEDRKAAFFSEGQMIFSGGGSLTVKANYKHALASDDYIQFAESTGTLNLTAASDGIHANDALYFAGGTFVINAGSDGIQCDSTITFAGGTFTISAGADGIQSDTAHVVVNAGEITVTKAGDKGITAFSNITVSGGKIRISSEYKCIKAKGNLTVSGGDIQVVCNGTASSSGGGGRPGDWSSSTENSSPEGIEAKGAITISGGLVYSQSADDAINYGVDFTITGGCVCAYSTGNDGLDANGNCYIKGGLIYALGARSPEVAIDANSEERKQLYVSGGTLVAVGSLESSASLTQTCYSASGSTNTWYALVVGNETFAFKTPSSNASTLVVSGASKPALYKGVSASGTDIFKGIGYYPASYTGGTSVSLSTYSASSGGGGGGRPGGW